MEKTKNNTGTTQGDDAEVEITRKNVRLQEGVEDKYFKKR